MKVYYEQPKKEVLIVKPDENRLEYEFWLITPVRIGGARRAGTQRIIDDNGHEYTNLQLAIDASLEARGEMELLSPKKDSTHRSVGLRLTGFDIVEKGKWAEFCKLKKLSPRDTSAMGQEYFLTKKEASELGLE